MNCNDAVTALVASLETGEPMNDAQREHIRTCERCRGLLDSAKEFQNALEGNGITAPHVDAAVAAAEDEVRRKRIRRIIGAVMTMAVLLVTGVMLMVLPFGEAGRGGFWVFAAGMGVLLSAGIAVLIAALFYLLRTTAKRRIYKRPGPGSWIAGVCRGIAENLNVDIIAVRIVFVALLFLADGIGFWLYLVLVLALPVHPDDRQHLLRFRLRRWWQRRTAHADHAAG